MSTKWTTRRERYCEHGQTTVTQCPRYSNPVPATRSSWRTWARGRARGAGLGRPEGRKYSNIFELPFFPPFSPENLDFDLGSTKFQVCPTYCAVDGGVFFVQPPSWFFNK